MKTTILILIVLINFCKAQVSQEWLRTYTNTANGANFLTSAVMDASGNIYIVGSSEGPGTSYDFATVVYTSEGAMKWVQRFNGAANGQDWAYAIGVDQVGDVYVTGRIEIWAPDYAIATVKYSAAGVQQWSKTFQGPGDFFDAAYSLAIDNQNNVIVSGITYDDSSFYDYCTIKYDPEGNLIWSKIFDGPGNSADYEKALCVDALGNIYVTGSSVSSVTPGAEDFATIKYDSAGNVLWISRYNGPDNYTDEPHDIAVDAQGNVYVTGFTSRNSTGYYDYATIKYNSNGDSLWVKRYIMAGNDVATDLELDRFGNVYVTGYSRGDNANYDYLTIKYNSAGNQLWSQRYPAPGNGDNYCWSVAVDSSGGVYITGGSYGNGTINDIATIKYNTQGDEQWLRRYNGPANNADNGIKVLLDDRGATYVAGTSTQSGIAPDFTVIKYSQATGVSSSVNSNPPTYVLNQNYPNPFNPSTVITYELSSRNYVTLNVYNILGQRVASLVNEIQNAGSYNIEFDGNDLSTGIYILRMSTGEFAASRIMNLVK